MSYFSFTVPGQPVSWNAAFKVRRYKLPNGEWQRGIRKTPEAEAFQHGVQMIAQAANTLRFDKNLRVLVAYEFALQNDIDCDNLLKLLNDALSKAIGLNDRHFMPVVMSKTIRNAQPFTRVTVYDASKWRVSITEG